MGWDEAGIKRKESNNPAYVDKRFKRVLQRGDNNVGKGGQECTMPRPETSKT